MKIESAHLEGVIKQHNRTCNLQIVFFDVESYSKRRTLNQIAVIDSLNQCVREALNSIAKEYVDYTQKNDLNFKTDVITIPTGDGAAVIFSFDGLADIHLNFARTLLKSAHDKRAVVHCIQFEQEGWCNCHAHFNLRVGVSDERGIIFEDVNGNYNVAGNVINLCSRVMSQAERNQIMFTEGAYKRIIDMATDPSFLQKFIEHKDISIKHGENICMYQYVSPEEEFINSKPPIDITAKKQMINVLEKMQNAMATPFIKKDSSPKEIMKTVEQFSVIADMITKMSPPVIEE